MRVASPVVTPVILTYNEDQNIEPTLASLAWAERIVLLDSGSTDRTEEIARSFDNVSWFVRRFDNHASQWRYAIQETSISTEYVLALDADMRPGAGFQDELEKIVFLRKFAGAWIPFEYRVLGRGLPSSIYPAQIRLFRKNDVRIEQPGHTQVFYVNGPLYQFRSNLIHEDHKPVSRWLSNQMKYASLEASRIKSTQKKGFKDRLRTAGISPLIWSLSAYIKAGGPLNLASSRAYAYERMIFEAVLARVLIEQTGGCETN
ncbi:MAG: glycosyltransferase family 2 protein [Bryobacteraceae bacterium]